MKIRLLLTAVNSGYLQRLLSVLDFKNVEIAKILIVDMPFGDSFNININEQNVPCASYEFLRETVKETYFDYALPFGAEDYVISELVKEGVPREKIFDVRQLKSDLDAYELAELLYNIEELNESGELSDYDLFIVGMSYSQSSLYLSEFSMKAISAAVGSQDFYYDYLFVKRVFSLANAKFKYALLGAAPFSLHYDVSKSHVTWRLLPYLIAFSDVRNFYIPIEILKAIFTAEFLNPRRIYRGGGVYDFNDRIGSREKNDRPLGVGDRIASRASAEHWNNRFFPETKKENLSYLRKSIDICLKNHTIPIITIYPLSIIYRRFFSKKLLDEFYFEIKKIAEETGALIWNYYEYKGIKLEDYLDIQHMRLYDGAKKFTPVVDADLKKLDVEGFWRNFKN